MEHWGYVRVSTDRTKQGASYQDQIDALTRAEVEIIIREEASAGGPRPHFTKMLDDAADRAEESKTLVAIHVTKLDRAFRDVEDAIRTVKRYRRQNVLFVLHDISPDPLDPKNSAQTLIFTVLAAIGQFEKDRFAERRAVGIAKAKREGKYKGRAPTARAKTDKVLAYHAKSHTPADIAKLADISQASVYRILKAHRDAQPAG